MIIIVISEFKKVKIKISSQFIQNTSSNKSFKDQIILSDQLFV